jgi:peptide/nickel transport system substrate-binding protein
MTRRYIFFLILPLLLWAGCKPEPTATGAVVSQSIGPVRELHPGLAGGGAKAWLLPYLFQSLMETDPASGEGRPWLLAEAPEASADQRSYRYRLHPRAAWPDGSPITAADVAFTARVMVFGKLKNGDLHTYTTYLDRIETDPADPKRFTLHVSQYYIHNDNFGYFLPILDPRAFDPKGLLGRYSLGELRDSLSAAFRDTALLRWAQWFNSPAAGTDSALINSGSGPYRLRSLGEGKRVVLVRKARYWGQGLGEPFHQQSPDSLIFEHIADEAALEARLRAQELDVSFPGSPGLFRSLMADSSFTRNYRGEVRRRDSFVSIVLNQRLDGISRPAFFSDPQVRQALALALPLDRMIADHLDTMNKRTVSPVAIQNPAYNPRIRPLPHDPQEAARLLEAAGWKDSDGDGIREQTLSGATERFSFELLCPSKPQEIVDFVERVRSEWLQVGVEARIKFDDKYASAVQDRKYEASLLSLGASVLPYDFHQVFYSRSAISGSNYMGYNSPAADSLILAARTEPDAARRRLLSDSLQQLLYREQPMIYLYTPVRRVLLHKRFGEAPIYDLPVYVQLNALK